MSWSSTAHEPNDAHAALAVAIRATYDDIEIITYESNSSKAR